MKLLILYEELATYFFNALIELATKHQAKVLIVMKPINTVAPFEFKNYPDTIEIIDRHTLTATAMKERIRAFEPDATYLSGWIYKPYLHAIQALKLRRVVIGFDNQYRGDLRQLFGSFYFRWFIKKNIKAAFVPGKKQVKFAKHLGFKPHQIAEGLYCCDVDLFKNYYNHSHAAKQQHLPKRFLFVGRYAPEKGIQALWQAFAELDKEEDLKWELWCVGKGALEPYAHPKIKHLGFLQPHDLQTVIAETTVFVLPSSFEPWGVVIQEYAIAGFPIITTTSVGAAELFVNDTANGFLLEETSVATIKQALKQMVHLSDNKILEMSERSHNLGLQLTPQLWCERFIQLIHGN